MELLSALVMMVIVVFMGYFGNWRWMGIAYLFAAGAWLWAIQPESAVELGGTVLFPVILYFFGMLMHRWKKGTWPADSVKEEMESGYLYGEDTNGPYVVWETEAPMMSVGALAGVVAVFTGAVYLLNHSSGNIPAIEIVGMLVAVVSGMMLFVSLILLNRTRYRYGCYSEGYGYEISDPRYLGASSASIAAGAADGDASVAGAGFLAKGGLGGMQRKWSTAEWYDYDEEKRIVKVSHGCCKTDRLYCTEKSYPIVINLVKQHVSTQGSSL